MTTVYLKEGVIMSETLGRVMAADFLTLLAFIQCRHKVSTFLLKSISRQVGIENAHVYVSSCYIRNLRIIGLVHWSVKQTSDEKLAPFYLHVLRNYVEPSLCPLKNPRDTIVNKLLFHAVWLISQLMIAVLNVFGERTGIPHVVSCSPTWKALNCLSSAWILLKNSSEPWNDVTYA